ncbi:MAG: glycosyltransferase family 4 protein [Rhodospirillaceae bacterium]|jgi:glycosyltransferase involved in cell wall biosynthesis|nr:glycosyltransferase family 4 protein [Rhodospirillaceae bacterium]
MAERQTEAIVEAPLAGRRVLFLAENLPCPFHTRVWQEARTIHAAGAEVSIICPTAPGYERRYEVIDGIHIHRHPLPIEARRARGFLLEYSAAMIWQFALAWRVFLGRGFDVIHAANPPDLLFLIGGFFKLLFGRKFIYDQHDINPELYLAKFARRDVFYRLLLRCERWSYRLADVAVVPNESYREIALSRGGLAPEKVFVVRNAPDLDRMQPRPGEANWKKDRRFGVGYVGVMGRQEGLHHLLAAIDHLVHGQGRQDIQFLCVGDGPERRHLMELARELDITEYVSFPGRLPDDEMVAALCAADLCVNSDDANELNDKSTMLKIVEYMALGKPIVQFDLSEGRISAQDAALYAKPNDPVDLGAKIIALLEDPDARQRMGALGRTRVEEELAWHYQAPKLLAAYAALWPER